MSEVARKIRNRQLRTARVRSRIHGTAERPRLSVHVSLKHITAQLIDDDTGKTLAFATSVGSKQTGNMTERAALIGKELAGKAKKAKLSRAIFDRGPKLYHGRIKALAEASREAGLEI